MRRLRKFLTDPRGATAAEFALILPVALLFLLGIIDVGRYFWTINKLEKAVQVGTRYAVATDLVAPGLNAQDYVGATCGTETLVAGDTICREALSPVTCTATACTCTGSNCPADLTNDAAAFTALVTRMRVIAPQIQSGDVRISYAGSGIGFAGDPRLDDAGDPLSQISPVVTVQVLNQRLRAISLLGAGLRLPSFQYSQTLEDGDGAIAY
jgi:Flp pilus assembly protein TadG